MRLPRRRYAHEARAPCLYHRVTVARATSKFFCSTHRHWLLSRGRRGSTPGHGGRACSGPGTRASVARNINGVLVEGYAGAFGSVRVFHINLAGTYIAGSDFAESLPALLKGTKAPCRRPHAPASVGLNTMPGAGTAAIVAAVPAPVPPTGNSQPNSRG